MDFAATKFVNNCFCLSRLRVYLLCEFQFLIQPLHNDFSILSWYKSFTVMIIRWPTVAVLAHRHTIRLSGARPSNATKRVHGIVLVYNTLIQTPVASIKLAPFRTKIALYVRLVVGIFAEFVYKCTIHSA